MLPLDIPTGIVKSQSANGAGGRYTDADKVRFVAGKPEKWKGNKKFVVDQLLGVSRGAVSWTNQHGNINAAFGTHLKLYVLTGSDTVTDITPIRSTVTINADPFSMVNGDATVTVTDTAHGADDGDFVTFSGATAAGGITISGEYQVTYVDADTYTIEHSSAATSTATGGGASVSATYQINVGTDSGVVGLGWGAGTWGTGTWGTERTSGIDIALRSWSLSEYGSDLLASPSNDTLYLWEEAADTNAEIVTNAPSVINAMFVTSERFVFALQPSMLVSWPDQDDITDWTATSANTANSRTLQSGSDLRNGTALTDGISLVWSDTSLYVFQYTGSDLVYDSRLAGQNCGLLAPKGFAVASGVAFWISNRTFKMYAGGVQDVPKKDDVATYVFDNMNQSHIDKVWAEYDEANNQVRWHYCHGLSTEPDRYVDVSLDDWSWTVGTRDATTSTLYRSGELLSLRVSSDSYIYLEGVGTDDDSAALESYLTWGLYAMESGARSVDVFGIVPDFERHTGDIDFEVYTKERPNSTSNYDEQTVTASVGEEIVDCRVAGRHFGMTMRSNVVGGDFRLGVVSLETQGAGRRR